MAGKFVRLADQAADHDVMRTRPGKVLTNESREQLNRKEYGEQVCETSRLGNMT